MVSETFSETSDDYYDKLSSGYEKLHFSEQIRKAIVVRHLIKSFLINFPSNKPKLLDVGCGTGIASEVFKCSYVGVDPSIEMIRQAKKRNGFFVQAKAEALPFKEASFDIVVSITSIHNFDGVKQGIEEMKRVGRQVFVFSVLKKSSSFSEISFWIKKNFIIKKIVEEQNDTIFLTEVVP